MSILLHLDCRLGLMNAALPELIGLSTRNLLVFGLEKDVLGQVSGEISKRS